MEDDDHMGRKVSLYLILGLKHLMSVCFHHGIGMGTFSQDPMHIILNFFYFPGLWKVITLKSGSYDKLDDRELKKM